MGDSTTGDSSMGEGASSVRPMPAVRPTDFKRLLGILRRLPIKEQEVREAIMKAAMIRRMDFM